VSGIRLNVVESGYFQDLEGFDPEMKVLKIEEKGGCQFSRVSNLLA
jgi:hypothetical protein